MKTSKHSLLRKYVLINLDFDNDAPKKLQKYFFKCQYNLLLIETIIMSCFQFFILAAMFILCDYLDIIHHTSVQICDICDIYG